jgi:hypothetical protein
MSTIIEINEKSNQVVIDLEKDDDNQTEKDWLISSTLLNSTLSNASTSSSSSIILNENNNDEFTCRICFNKMNPNESVVFELSSCKCKFCIKVTIFEMKLKLKSI